MEPALPLHPSARQQPALEHYWAGFCAQFIAALDRRWCRKPLLDRLAHAALDVGIALVDESKDASSALDRLSWLLEIADRTSTLAPGEAKSARTAIDATRAMLTRTPARSMRRG